ncbi:acyl-coa-binding protein [Cardiosporidium cionae]|uniref:Acyl-coa-binding protein n=1 Tax=Cardiosporidium cionae TaxID=476202 RepID=A0ABQ7J9V0_9APIC|nr:acyl-coa-binding protein [Cardiosporidium cionae]|eukprot:KAF8820775.1 acyl-coa-binding protein [Cardiosporidium cionae]
MESRHWVLFGLTLSASIYSGYLLTLHYNCRKQRVAEKTGTQLKEVSLELKGNDSVDSEVVTRCFFSVSGIFSNFFFQRPFSFIARCFNLMKSKLPLSMVEETAMLEHSFSDEFIEEIIQNEFEKSCTAMRNNANLHISKEQQLQFYGLYKHATLGNCTETCPNPFNWKRLSQWEHWRKFAGTSRRQAMIAYIEESHKICSDIENTISTGDIESAPSLFKHDCIIDSPLKYEEMGENEDCDIDAFLEAVVLSDQETVFRMYSVDNSIIQKKDKNGLTALHYAADRGFLEMVIFLLENGAGINEQDENSETPLHLAVIAERVNVAEELIKRGADLSIRNVDGEIAKSMSEALSTAIQSVFRKV